MADSENIPMSRRTPSPWIVPVEIQKSVIDRAQKDPASFRQAQRWGDFIMNTPFANTDTFKIPEEDLAGESIMYEEIIKNMASYNLKPVDLHSYEIEIIRKKLGTNWKQELTEKFGLLPEDFPSDN